MTPEQEELAQKYIANEADVSTSTSLLRAALADRQKTAGALGNLLAIIHRDGGHHQAQVGDEQAVKDAHERWGRLITLAERAERAEAALADERQHHARTLASCQELSRSLHEQIADLHATRDADEAHRLRVVAVAIKTAKDGVVHALPPPNRHHNVIHALHYAGIDQGGREEEGFLLSDGSFADRPRALVVARAAGQVLRETGPHIGLFSEDVW